MGRTAAAPRSPPEGLEDALLALLQGTMRIVRQEAVRAGLSMPQMLVLRWLRRTGSRPATGWAPRIGARPSTVSGLVDGLVTAGLVRRDRDATDRRKVLVSLTPAGRRRIDRVAEAQRRHLARALAGLSGEDRAAATRALKDLSDRLAADVAGSRSGGRDG